MLQESSLDGIIGKIEAGKGTYESEYKYFVFVKGNEALAHDAAILLVYRMLKCDFNDPHKDSMTFFNAV